MWKKCCVEKLLNWYFTFYTVFTLHGLICSRLAIKLLNSSEACLFGCDHIQTHIQAGQWSERPGVWRIRLLRCMRRSDSNENTRLKTLPWAAQLSWSRCVRERAGYVCQCVKEQRGQLCNLSSIEFQIKLMQENEIRCRSTAVYKSKLWQCAQTGKGLTD